MKAIKVKKIYIPIFIFMLVMGMSDSFFYLKSQIRGIYPLILTLVGVFSCFFMAKREIKIIKNKMSFIYNYFIITFFELIFIFLFTLIKFEQQSLYSTISAGGYYFYILLAIILLCYMIRIGKQENIYLFLNFVSAIWYALVLYQKIIFESNKTIIISTYFDTVCGGIVPLRNDAIRISLLYFGNLMILYNFYKFYVNEGKKRWLYFTLFGVGFWELIAIQQTRGYTICIAISLLIIVCSTKNSIRELLRKFFLVLFLIIFFMQTDIINGFVSSFSSTGIYSNSTIYRSYALTYYWNYFIEHPIFGMGFASSTYYPTVVKGLTKLASIDDVGVVGQFAKLGIFCISIYIIILFRLGFIVKKMKKNVDKSTFIWYLAFYIYILTTSFSLCILDKQRIMLFPIAIALFEYAYYQIKN